MTTLHGFAQDTHATPIASPAAAGATTAGRDSVIRIGALLPDIMSTYGDDGNALVLRERLRRRGWQAEIVRITLDDSVPASCDIYTIGGGEDVAQVLAAQHLRTHHGLCAAVEAGRPLLAICAGLQILGEWFQLADGSRVEGVGLLDATTSPQKVRTIGELVGLPLIEGVTEPLTGFENHMGATVLGESAHPLSQVRYGIGNGTPADGGADAGTRASVGATTHSQNASAPAGTHVGVGASTRGAQPAVDGVVQGSIIATYMHGPCLARNPQLADYLISRVVGTPVADLPPLDIPAIPLLRKERLAAAKHPPKRTA